MALHNLNGYLRRYRYSKGHTLGTLYIDGAVFHTIERAWDNNKRNVSCIPKGEYDVFNLPRSNSGKYRNVFHLVSVKGRSGILIHKGNLASHSKGCIIIGMRAGMLGKKRAVLNSKTAMIKLNKIAKNGFRLLIC